MANPSAAGDQRASAVSFAGMWEGRQGKPAPRTGFGKTDFPGSLGGLGKRGHGGTVHSTRNRKGDVDNPPPVATRAPALSRPYSEGIANHAGLGSYAVARKGGGGTLIEVRTGRALSREISYIRAPTPYSCAEGNTNFSDPRRAGVRPCEVRDPRHVRKHAARRLGDPMVVCESGRPCRKV